MGHVERREPAGFDNGEDERGVEQGRRKPDGRIPAQWHGPCGHLQLDFAASQGSRSSLTASSIP